MFLNVKIHKKLIYPLALVILFGCQLKEASNTHGILFLENRANKLFINKTNKNDAINIIGYPHSKSINNENEWIYIERVFVKGKYHQLGRNILKSNNVLYLEFDKFGILKNKKLFDKEDIEKISFTNKTTENELSQKSFIEKMFTSLKAKMYNR